MWWKIVTHVKNIWEGRTSKVGIWQCTGCEGEERNPSRFWVGVRQPLPWDGPRGTRRQCLHPERPHSTKAQTSPWSVELVFKTRLKSGACEVPRCFGGWGTQTSQWSGGLISLSSQVAPPQRCGTTCPSAPLLYLLLSSSLTTCQSHASLYLVPSAQAAYLIAWPVMLVTLDPPYTPDQVSLHVNLLLGEKKRIMSPASLYSS